MKQTTNEAEAYRKKHLLLDKVEYPDKLRQLDQSRLSDLCKEIREEIIYNVSKTGGHLGPGLGVVELTVALHYVFDTPHDKLIWDVGHQAYPHKILTGRRKLMSTLRQKGGISGFTKRSESEYDPFGAGHASTSISAALGIAVGKKLKSSQEKPCHVIAVIGDGAMSGGMAYEAMNNAGSLGAPLLVILNDNDMSIAEPVGGMSQHLARLVSSPFYRAFRERAKEVSHLLPNMLMQTAKHSEEMLRNMHGSPATMFEQLGFYYIGPVDGHDIDNLIEIFKNIKAEHHKPVLLHVVTKKGRGYEPAEQAPDKLHGVTKFDVESGQPIYTKKSPSQITYTELFSEAILDAAARDEKIFAITAAMPQGTGLAQFAKTYNTRFLDVGIAEQHAVTFAAGLATEGYKPFVAVYSTFLQRAYDQIIHDVALQNLPVRFAIDRGGFVGADGATHAGSFDIAYLANVSNMVVMAPSSADTMRNMVRLAAQYDESPSAFRYPRDNAITIDQEQPVAFGKAWLCREGTRVALLSYGTMLVEAMEAAKMLEDIGISCSVVDARFCRPIDTDLLRQMVANHELVLTIEEGVLGGFAAIVNDYVLNHLNISNNFKLANMMLPDRFLPHGDRASTLSEIGLDKLAIVARVCNILGVEYASKNQAR